MSKCKHCDYESQSTASLVRHTRTHTPNTPNDLREILEQTYAAKLSPHHSEQAILNWIEKEVVGDTEIEYSNLDGDAGYWEKHGRNELRAQMRAKLRRSGE